VHIVLGDENCGSGPEPVGTAVALYLNRFFRTFGAIKKQKYPSINNLYDLGQSNFRLLPKSVQVIDRQRLVQILWFEAAPKVRKIRIEYKRLGEFRDLSTPKRHSASYSGI
jgi:hypothetical protein